MGNRRRVIQEPTRRVKLDERGNYVAWSASRRVAIQALKGAQFPPVVGEVVVWVERKGEVIAVMTGRDSTKNAARICISMSVNYP